MERLYERMEANLFAAWARYATGSPDGRPTGFEPVTFVGVSWQVGLPAGRNRAAQNTDVSVEGPIRCAEPPADQSASASSASIGVSAVGPFVGPNTPICTLLQRVRVGMHGSRNVAQTAAECAISTIALRRFTRERSLVRTQPRP